MPRASRRSSMSREPEVALDAGFARIVASFEQVRGVKLDRGWAAGNYVLKVNDRIFAMLDRGRFVTKLPKARVDDLVAAGQGSRFDPRKNGTSMKEWFVATATRADWSELAHDAYRFVKAGKR
jgi:hypothetical protein